MTDNGALRERFMEAAIANPWLLERVSKAPELKDRTFTMECRVLAELVADFAQSCANEAMKRRI